MYGEGPGNCFDGMTTLAALAPATTRIRLGLLVAGVTYRHPSVFAAQALTIDHASHGRLDLSLGRGLVRARAPHLRDPVPGGWRTLRPARRRARDRHATDDRRTRLVCGRARVARRRAAAAPPRPASAPADLARHQRPPARPAGRREVGRRVAHLRPGRALRGHVEAGRPARRGGGSRPGGDPPGRVALHLRAVGRSAAQRRRDAAPSASATSCAAGPARAKGASASSPNASCPSSPM